MKKLTIQVPKIKQRIVWNFNPVSRVKPSKKLYNRQQIKLNTRIK